LHEGRGDEDRGGDQQQQRRAALGSFEFDFLVHCVGSIHSIRSIRVRDARGVPAMRLARVRSVAP
jgi:hypothetical protein